MLDQIHIKLHYTKSPFEIQEIHRKNVRLKNMFEAIHAVHVTRKLAVHVVVLGRRGRPHIVINAFLQDMPFCGRQWQATIGGCERLRRNHG
jgi:hypothetical protein